MHTNGYVGTAGAQGTGYAGSLIVKGATDRILVLDDGIERTNGAITRVMKLTDALREKADATFGPMPPTPDLGDKVATVPIPGRAAGLRATLDVLHERLTVLEAQAERFGDL